MRDNTDVSSQVEWLLNWLSESRIRTGWFNINVKLMTLLTKSDQREVFVIEVCSYTVDDFSDQLKPILIDNTGEVRKYYFHPNPDFLNGLDLLEDIKVY